MSKDLIERLLDNRVTGFNLTVAAVEAADLIEAQAAQIELMREEHIRACKKLISGKVKNEQWWYGFRSGVEQCIAAITVSKLPDSHDAEPKVRKIKMECFLIDGELQWRDENLSVLSHWVRQPHLDMLAKVPECEQPSQ